MRNLYALTDSLRVGSDHYRLEYPIYHFHRDIIRPSEEAGALLTRFATTVLMISALSTVLTAQRDPVLKQIDLPHRYYYREMYLPQLTTGPNSAAWTSDSRSLVYSMAGTLWRQAVDSDRAEQLTADAGYDYQPDCSPDDHWIVYVSYQHDAMELRVFDLEKRQSHQLTSGGAV